MSLLELLQVTLDLEWWQLGSLCQVCAFANGDWSGGVPPGKFLPHSSFRLDVLCFSASHLKRLCLVSLACHVVYTRYTDRSRLHVHAVNADSKAISWHV